MSQTDTNAKADAQATKKEKQTFTAPQLRRHEDLPEITGITFGAGA